jgi:hypothetical protein
MSPDAGLTWTQPTPFVKIDGNDLAVSSDLSVLAAAGYIKPYRVFSSLNFGVSWFTGVLPVDKFYRVAMSADGRVLAAAIWKGGIWYSHSSGKTGWYQSDARSARWHGLAASADGSIMAATIDGDRVWRSLDSGRTW